MTTPDIKFLKVAVFVNSAVPAVLLAWDAAHGSLGANPLEFVTRTTGALTLTFLVLSLAVTPVRKAFSIPWLVRFRRMTGLFAFFYGCLHLLTYVWFDKNFQVAAMVHDIGKRPFIMLGMLSFAIMVPLAITSTNGMVKRMGGKKWNLLHRTVYAAGVAGVLHYYLLVKADVRKPLAFGAALAVLLLYRVFNRYFPALAQRKPAAGNSPDSAAA